MGLLTYLAKISCALRISPASKIVSCARKPVSWDGMSVDIFKNRDDLFYAGLKLGHVDDNSAFIPVYQAHQVNGTVFSNDFYHGGVKIGDCANLLERNSYRVRNECVISA